MKKHLPSCFRVLMVKLISLGHLKDILFIKFTYYSQLTDLQSHSQNSLFGTGLETVFGLENKL